MMFFRNKIGYFVIFYCILSMSKFITVLLPFSFHFILLSLIVILVFLVKSVLILV